MKGLLKIAIPLLALAVPSHCFALGGCSSSGCGGNFSATEFKDLAADVFTDLRALKERGPITVEVERYDADKPEKKQITIDPEELRAAFKSVTVVNDQLFLDGKPVSFKSDPNSQHVDFSEKDWKDHPYRISRMRMVIHELLMLASKKNPALDDYLYDEQLSRGLAKLCVDEEARSQPQAQGKSLGTHCLLVYQRKAWLDLSYKAPRLFEMKAATEQLAREYVVRKCQESWPAESEQCHNSAVRCSPVQAKRQACEYQPPGFGNPFQGYGSSATEAEYQARSICLNGSGWKKCLEENHDRMKMECGTATGSGFSAPGRGPLGVPPDFETPTDGHGNPAL